MVDQPCLARNRLNRLVGVLTRHPGLVGFGVDEGTALVVDGRRLSVVGRSCVTVVLTAGDGRPQRIDTLRDGIRTDLVAFRRAAGARKVSVLHARTVAEIEKRSFLEPLGKARGVWFTGGRQWRLVDAYEGTRALELFHAVLARGGVIGGSSAGTSIQAGYLVRGNPLGNREIMFEGFHRARQSIGVPGRRSLAARLLSLTT